MRFFKWTFVVVSLLALLHAQSADSKKLLSDAGLISGWKNLKLNTELKRGEERAFEWQGYDKSLSVVWTSDSVIDLSAFKALTFWVHSAQKKEVTVSIQFLSPGANGPGDYLFSSFLISGEGWKQVTLRLVDFKISREGNLKKVKQISFNAKGWGASVVPGTQLAFSQIQLLSTESVSVRFQTNIPVFEEIGLTDEKLAPYTNYFKADSYRLAPWRYLDLKAEKPWASSLRLPSPLTPADVLGPDGIIYPDFKYAGVVGGIPQISVVTIANDYGLTDGGELNVPLRKAVNAAIVKGGGAVLIKAGTYWLTEPFVITNSKVVLRGEGTNQTFIKYAIALKAKEVRMVSPSTDGEIFSMDKSSCIEVWADSDQMSELEVSVGSVVFQKTVMNKLVTGTYRKAVQGQYLREKLSPGEQTVKAVATWRDGTQTEVTRKIILQDKGAGDWDNRGAESMFCFRGPGEIDGTLTNLTKDGKRGDLEIQVESTKAFTVGDLIRLRAEPTPEFIKKIKSAYAKSPRIVEVYVTKIEGNTLYLNQPLRIDFPVSDNSTVVKVTALVGCGVESLTIDNTDPQGRIWQDGIGSRHLQNSWLKNVRVIKAGRNPIMLENSKNCEVRDCHFEDAWYKDGGGTAYVFWSQSWDCLMENITGNKLRHAPNFQYTAAGCVIRNVFFEDSDAQFHAFYAFENLIENCVVRSKRGNGSYGFGLYTQEPEATSHGPLGPRNVIWNSDFTSELPGIWCGGMTEGWIFAYNRIVSGQGPSIIAKAGCFDYTIRGNYFLQKNAQIFGGIYLMTPDCLGWVIEKNTFSGSLTSYVTGLSKPELFTDNQLVAFDESLGRPNVPVPSLFEWMKKR